MSGEKIDIFKMFKEEYKAGKKPLVVETGRAMYLAAEGKSAPGSEEFQSAIEGLYGMAYTIKMGRKKAGKGDYTISKLEGIYWTTDGADLATAPVENWCWLLMIRTPESVDGHPLTEDDLTTALSLLHDRKKEAGADRVKLMYLDPARYVQMLHVGPYEMEHETLAVMAGFCAAENLEPHGRHHEIYLSDPRRVAPEKLKTILRMQVG